MRIQSTTFLFPIPPPSRTSLEHSPQEKWLHSRICLECYMKINWYIVPGSKLQRMGQTSSLQQDAISTSHGDGEINLIVSHQNFLMNLDCWRNCLLKGKSAWNYHQIWTSAFQTPHSLHSYNQNFHYSVRGCNKMLSGNCYKNKKKIQSHKKSNKLTQWIVKDIFPIISPKTSTYPNDTNYFTFPVIVAIK